MRLKYGVWRREEEREGEREDTLFLQQINQIKKGQKAVMRCSV